MAYLFNTADQQREMLKMVGASSVDELFDQVPSELRLDRPLQLPPPMSELELESHLRELAGRNLGSQYVVARGRIKSLGLGGRLVVPGLSVQGAGPGQSGNQMSDAEKKILKIYDGSRPVDEDLRRFGGRVGDLDDHLVLANV